MPEVTGAAVQVEVKNIKEVDNTEVPTANGTVENGVSSTSPEKNEAEILLAQGKRHLYVKDYPNAVATLGDACVKLSEMYGDMADECADAYFNYGRALLELAREESNVLGPEPDKEQNSEEEEDDDDNDEEEGGEEEEDGDNKKNEDTERKIEMNDEKGTEEKQVQEKSHTDEKINEVSEESEEATGDGKEEDVDNLQLAWEVFELAKKIFERQKADGKLAETYLYLGEVGLESENYSGAIDDMKRCIEVQKQILPPDHRDIAETYFQLGVACSLCNEFDDAIINFQTSSEILETRIKNLEKNGSVEVDTEKNPFYSVEEEIKEIKALLPEIKAKILDMEDFKQETIKSVMASLKDKPQSSDGSGPSSSTSSSVPVTNGSILKPATDISHLVRKKRKPEEEVSSEKCLKKACTKEANK